MPEQKAKIIPEPAPNTRTVLNPAKGPAISGNGDFSTLCGNCGVILLKNVQFGQVRNIVIRCSNCGKFNDIT